MTKTQANEPGFVLVPREPTEAMLDAAVENLADDIEGGMSDREFIGAAYGRLLAAAPIVPAPAYGVKEALEPFAKLAERHAAFGDDRAIRPDSGAFITVGDLRRARTVYDALSSAPVEEAEAKAASLYGPYGWIVKPVGLAEDEWELEADPEEDTVNFVSVPLYAAEPQALGVTAQPASTIPSEPEAKCEAGAGPMGEAVAQRGIKQKPLGYVSASVLADLAEGEPTWLYPHQTPSLSVPVYIHAAFGDALETRAEIPIGWHLVPEIPTDDQMSAGLYQASHNATADDVCRSYMDMVRTPLDAPPLYARPAEAGPVGEADFYAVSTRTGMHVGLWKDRTTAENVLREYEEGTLTPLYTSPVEEPGEVERLARERDAALKLAEFVGGKLPAAEAALAETRERLEKVEEALRNLVSEGKALKAFEFEIRDAVGSTNWTCFIQRIEAANAALSTQESSAALADGKEAGR